MDERDKLKLKHMQLACEELIKFTNEIDEITFSSDRILTLACIKEIEIIGEAANKITLETKLRLDTIPWDDIIGARNRLIHGYYNINLKIVWKTIKEDIPELLRLLESSTKV